MAVLVIGCAVVTVFLKLKKTLEELATKIFKMCTGQSDDHVGGGGANPLDAVGGGKNTSDL